MGRIPAQEVVRTPSHAALEGPLRTIPRLIESGFSGSRNGRNAAPRAGACIATVLLTLFFVVAASATANAEDAEADPLFDDLFDEELEAGPTGYPDPWENTNRGTFAFNRVVDRWLLDPLTEGYRWAVPKGGRDAIYRVFKNLSSTKVIVNDFLQLEWVDAGVTVSRLVINTTVGIVGIFDVAAKIGLDGHDSDFGQTLALAGTPSGPFIILPVLGPSTVRDGVGVVIDGFFQPTFYILGPADLLFGPTEILLFSGSSGISTRDQRYIELKSLEESSIDFYAAMRNGFYQDRVDAIWARRPGHRTTGEPSVARDSGSLDADDWDPLAEDDEGDFEEPAAN